MAKVMESTGMVMNEKTRELTVGLQDYGIFRRLAVPALGEAPYVMVLSTIFPQAKRILIVNRFQRVMSQNDRWST